MGFNLSQICGVYSRPLLSLRSQHFNHLEKWLCPGQKIDMLEKVRLRSSELTSCEWCSVRKLPVLFFQTSDSECQRLRTQLQMSQESGGLWYDCSGESECLSHFSCMKLLPGFSALLQKLEEIVLGFHQVQDGTHNPFDLNLGKYAGSYPRLI